MGSIEISREEISIFEIFKVGIGPSSSHTMGPWKAAIDFLGGLEKSLQFDLIKTVYVDLYGSLAKTGRGHATPMGICLGLMGEKAEEIESGLIPKKMAALKSAGVIFLLGKKKVAFKETQIRFLYQESLSKHPNGMRFEAILEDGTVAQQNYYSIGGGFIEKDPLMDMKGNRIVFPSDEVGVGGKAGGGQKKVLFPYSIASAQDLLDYCEKEKKEIHEIVLANECSIRDRGSVEDYIEVLKTTMIDSIFRGCHKEGVLPGGLRVKRRAADLNRSFLRKVLENVGEKGYSGLSEWIDLIKRTSSGFNNVTDWVTCFALAVNEENAASGRVVTAPTNGAAGVLPAVLLGYLIFERPRFTVKGVDRFFLVASEIGSLFKKGASISAAAGGCQAEIGVSSAMSAAGLCSLYTADPRKVLMAAEIAMEHHLGLTCDPIGGLVQVPCIERNAMGAIKAITASRLALASEPSDARVSLDEVIATMWETAQNMSHKYKETSEGGLAMNVSVRYSEC